MCSMGLQRKLTYYIKRSMVIDLSRAMLRVWVCVASLLLVFPYIMFRYEVHPTVLSSGLRYVDITDLRENGISFVTASTNSRRNLYLQYTGPLAFDVWNALNYIPQTGYILNNGTRIEFYPYGNPVDLRIIVLAYNRAKSLNKCLSALNDALYEGNVVSVHVWLDQEPQTNQPHRETEKVAQGFKFHHGSYQIHIQPQHVGIIGQWINTWRPGPGSKEVAVILEDDMTVSKFYWRWLKVMHSTYSHRKDISGYGLSHPTIAHASGTYLDIPTKHTLYLYRVICTWGFSPQSQSWRHFQEWFYEVEQNRTFEPLVPGILPSHWWKAEKRKGLERNLWEMWHIYYTHYSLPPQYTLLLNTPVEGLLAVNRHEVGIHDAGHKDPGPICLEWNASYINIPPELPMYGYLGTLEDS